MNESETPTLHRAESKEDIYQRLEGLEARVASLERKTPDDRVSIVVFSGDLDRVLGAFVIATGAAALGQQVSMFFTFWGLNVIRQKKSMQGKTFLQKVMAAMSPSTSRKLGVSKMNFFGIGSKMLRSMMKQKNVQSLEDLMQLAKQLGVKMIACEMSRDVMGVSDEELLPHLERGGVAAFLGDALKSRVTLFI